MGPVGWQEMVIIFIVALVLFGPKKLPELGRTLGKALTEFRRASNELKSTFEREMQSLEKETESLKDTARSYMGEINSHLDTSDGSHTGYDTNYGYDHSYDYGAYGHESNDSTASNPTTVGESAIQDAESHGTEAHPANGTNGVPGTVARQAGNDPASHEAPATPAEHHPSGADVAQHS